MNAVANHVLFASAYRQLSHAERAFVDSVVEELENAAHRRAERISLALNRPIPSPIVERARGFLDRPLVRASIAERINEIAAAQELTVQRMVREMMAVSFSSIGDYMRIDDDGQPYFDLSRCTPEQLAAIKTIDMEEIGDPFSAKRKVKFKITLHDKLGGMKMLGEYMGLLEPDNPHWRADRAQAAAPKLPAGTTTEQAGDAYAQMIGE